MTLQWLGTYPVFCWTAVIHPKMRHFREFSQIFTSSGLVTNVFYRSTGLTLMVRLECCWSVVCLLELLTVIGANRSFHFIHSDCVCECVPEVVRSFTDVILPPLPLPVTSASALHHTMFKLEERTYFPACLIAADDDIRRIPRKTRRSRGNAAPVSEASVATDAEITT